MSFWIDRREGQSACVLHVDGDIDVAVVPELQKALDQAIGTGCTNVVIDLECVSYADSSALGMLVWLDRRLQPLEGKAVLVGASEDIARILALSRILTVAHRLEEGADVESAVARFGASDVLSDPEWLKSFDVPADIRVLAGVREQVSELMAPMEFSESALFDIKVALGEALANAVRHGSLDDGSAGIHLVVSGYADRVVIDVTDSGAGFDGDHVCSDDLYAAGGRGIMFMRALMDQVLFSCTASGGTRVTLVKRRSSHASG